MEKIIKTLSNIIYSILVRLIALFRIKTDQKMLSSLMQFIRFGIVGLSNAVIGYISYILILTLLRHLNFPDSADYLISNVLSWIISVFWSFIWNRKCVFGEQNSTKGSFWSSLLKAYCSYALTGLVLSNLLLYIGVDKLGISKAIAPVFVMIINTPINFLLNKFWTFRTNEK